MKTELLKNYINRLNKIDIINYLNKENVYASNDEIDLLYNCIKNDHEYILKNNFIDYISNYKSKLNSNLYNKIIDKYNEYKKFIE